MISNYLPVPCPHCGGLVDRQTVRCTKCGASWEGVKALLYDGLCDCSERAAAIAECQEWNTVDAAVQGMQDVQDALSARGKYETEILKLERREG